MKRKIYQQFLDWKEKRNGEVALLVEGARRIGKSYIVEEFGKNEYESYILIDFNKAPQMVRDWFDLYLEDLDMLFLYLSQHYKVKLHERKSLIILDEVQLCPKARAAIKFLVADGRYDYIETGSLVSIKKNMQGIVLPSEERPTLKCYMNDTGLLLSHSFDEKGIVSSEIYQKLLFGKLEVNEGMLIENIVAQMLTASGNNLFFYSKSSEKAEERMEIDFLLQKDKVTTHHNIRPIEVKSGKNYTLSSLTKCMKKFGEYVTTPTVLHAADYKVVDGITYLPLYMTPLL